VDLLFTDVVLPGGLTGAQVAAQVRQLRPGLKVLFTTGYARNAIFHHGRLDKGVQPITKPFSFTDLAAKVDRTRPPSPLLPLNRCCTTVIRAKRAANPAKPERHCARATISPLRS